MLGGEYRECTYCLMDTSDPEIVFDEAGRCNHCLNFETFRGVTWFPDGTGERFLEEKILQIKNEGRNRSFDCVLGLSGGVDSSYLALKAREWGLRPLVVHVDAGWNSELAVQNIEQVIRSCDYELHTHVVNWDDMRELQLSYLRAAVSNQDVPQDHAFFAGLYHFATRNRVKYVLNGGNLATEGIFPDSWHGSAMDATNLRAIHKKFGTQKLKDYPLIDFHQYYVWYPLIKRMTPFRPLNLMPYSKEIAIRELSEIGWKAYPRKHGESIFTKFFQNHYLPVKFGFDKRRPHLSTLIAAGELTRASAVEILSEPLYEPDELVRDKEYLCKKLRITLDEFEGLMNLPARSYKDFPNWDRRYQLLKRTQGFVRRRLGRNFRPYS